MKGSDGSARKPPHTATATVPTASKAAALNRPHSSNPFNAILDSTAAQGDGVHRRQTLVRLVEEFAPPAAAASNAVASNVNLTTTSDSEYTTAAEIDDFTSANTLSTADDTTSATAATAAVSKNEAASAVTAITESTASTAAAVVESKVADLLDQLKRLVGDFDDSTIRAQAATTALAMDSKALEDLLNASTEQDNNNSRHRAGSKVRFSEQAPAALTSANTSLSPCVIQKQPFSNNSNTGATMSGDMKSTTTATTTTSTSTAAAAAGTVAAIRRSRDLEQLAERLSNVPALAHTLPVSLQQQQQLQQQQRGSRYSVGMNRFSTTAQQLSMDTLNYVSGSRFLTQSMRLPSNALTATVDARFLSPQSKNQQPQQLPPGAERHSLTPLAGSSTTAATTTATPTSAAAAVDSHSTCADTFAEFCVVGISDDVLSGRQPLERQSLQPTQISYRYPSTADAVVANLQEYCFPYGAKLHYVSKKGLEKVFKDVNTLQYQILQFTDARSRIYYATCIITMQPLDNVSEQLHSSLEELYNFTLASDTIKRYYRHYQCKKKYNFKKYINDAWAQNISKSRNTSLDSAFSHMNRNGNGNGNNNGTTATTAAAIAAAREKAALSGKQSKSAGKSLFKALNPFRKHRKSKGQSNLSTAPLAATAANKSSSHHHHRGGGGGSGWLGLGKQKTSFSSQSTDMSDEGAAAGGLYSSCDNGGKHNKSTLQLAAVTSGEDTASVRNGTNGSQQSASPSRIKRQAVDVKATTRFNHSLVSSPEHMSVNSDNASVYMRLQEQRSLSDGDDSPSRKYAEQLSLLGDSRPPSHRFSHPQRTRSRSFGDTASSAAAAATATDEMSLPGLSTVEHGDLDDISSVGSERDIADASNGCRVNTASARTGISSITQSGRSSSTGAAEGSFPSPLRDVLSNSAKVAVITERAYCFLSNKPLHPVLFQILEVIVQKERHRALDRCAMILHSSFFSKGVKRPSAVEAVPRSIKSTNPAATAGSNTSEAPKNSAVEKTSDSSSNNNSSGGAKEGERATVPSLFRSHSEMRSFYVDREAFLKHIRQFDLSILLVPAHLRRRSLSCDSTASNNNNSSSNNNSRKEPGSRSRRDLDLSLPEYVKNFSVSMRMLTLKEWTSALLFSLIPSELIVKILSLQLQEQSLLVFGSHSGLVTAVTTAFAQLLDPFTWEGIFVPLLPTAAYEALDAPVPYIIGIASSTCPAASMIASTAGVLHLDDFVNHGEQYVPTCFDDAAIRITITSMEQQRRSSAEQEEHVGSLRFFDSPCSVTDDASNSTGERMVLMEPSQCSRLKELNQVIAYHAGKISESSRQFSRLRMRKHSITNMMKGVLFHMSSESLRSLRTVLKRILEHNNSLCGAVLTQPGGYKKFGVVNSQTGWFEFLPELFMEPLKTRLKFQESVINTQLFVSFMDQQRVDYEACSHARRFIGEWIYFRVLLLKKRSRRRRSSHTLKA